MNLNSVKPAATVLAACLLAGCLAVTTEVDTALEPAATVVQTTPVPSAPATEPAPHESPTSELLPPATEQIPTAEAGPAPSVPTGETPVEPRVLSFSAVPAPAQVNLGDALRLEWQAAGERVELCPITGTGPADCREVPPSGSMDFVANEESLPYVQLGLRVTSGEEFVWSLVDITVGCQGLRAWFFADPPLRCPESEPQRSLAAAQNFEHGFMIWTETPDQFFVFFDERFSEEDDDPRKRFVHILAPYAFAEEQPIAEPPPPGFEEPVSGFGKLWRGELDGPTDDTFRQRLGWAVGAEFNFDADYQCEVRTHPRSWTCYLRAPDGRILVLGPASTAGVHLLWSEWPGVASGP